MTDKNAAPGAIGRLRQLLRPPTHGLPRADRKEVDLVIIRDALAAYDQAIAERDVLAERVKELKVPLCIGEPTIRILAEEGAKTFEDGRALVAASDLFRNDPYHLAEKETRDG